MTKKEYDKIVFRGDRLYKQDWRNAAKSLEYWQDGWYQRICGLNDELYSKCG